MKAYIVTNGKGHWRVIGDNEFDDPSFIADWSLDEFATGDDAVIAYEIDVPVAFSIDSGVPQVLIVPHAPGQLPD